LDSLRRDRVSAYGHDRETTPCLDQFGATATRYANAYTPAPWTLPTHVSLFTGMFPSEHGVTNVFPNSDSRLSGGVRTLAEKLKADGYRTAGFSNNPWVGQTSGLDRGFDDYIEWNLEIRHETVGQIHSRLDRVISRFHSIVGHAARQPAYLLKRPFFTDSLTRRATSWIESAAGGQPWFCFMNLMEAHSPYFPRQWAFETLGLEPPGPVEPRLLNTKLLAYIAQKLELSPETVKRVLEFYDASIRYQDRKVEAVLESLRDCGVFDDTLVVICSDHGKTLGEFDRGAAPSHYLRDINTRVPLLIKAPGQTTQRVVESPVELVSTYRFILDGGDRPFRSYQPFADYALFEDFSPHTGRTNPPNGVTHWRGVGTTDGKFVRNRAGETVWFDDKGLDEQARPEAAADDNEALAALLSDRVDELDDSPTASETQSFESFEGDVKAQLEDLGYM
jgi:choline-sulfatase